jgi:adenylate cyclase
VREEEADTAGARLRARFSRPITEESVAYQPILFEAERNFPLPPADLWDLLADTDQLNREIGLPHVAYGAVTVTADGIYRQATARLWGLLQARWREYPFEWVRGVRYAVLRVFEAGFLDTFYGGADLRPHPEGTSVRVFTEMTPRTLLGLGVSRLMEWKGVRETLAYCEKSVALRINRLDLLIPPPGRATPADPARLDRLAAALREAALSEPLVKRFTRHLATAPDREVLRMQPYALADGWGADRAAVLRLCVEAARLAALYQTWEILCPNCRVPREQAPTLAGLAGRFHCDVCAVDFGADLAKNVELRYSVHPSLRPAKDEIYCIGGPANFPHVLVQQYLLPATERAVSASLGNEALRVRALRSNVTCPLDPVRGGPAEVAFTCRDDGWYQIRQTFSPGPVTVRFRNETSRVVVAVIEQVQWDPRAITAAQVLAMPEFREFKVDGPPILT